MPLGHGIATLSAAPPIEYCPICYPQRPMVIKTVETTLRARPERFIFECPACGAVKQVPAPLLQNQHD
jgi:uncharacterized Zn finger protein